MEISVYNHWQVGDVIILFNITQVPSLKHKLGAIAQNRYKSLKIKYRISTINLLCLLFLAHILIKFFNDLIRTK